MSNLKLAIRGTSEAAMLLLLLLMAASVYADTDRQPREHEELLVLDVENMT